MSINFPSSLDNFTNPTASNDTSVVHHADQHANANDAIEAIEAKIGIGASTPVTQRLLRGTGTGTSSWAQVDLTTDVTGALPITNGGTGQTTQTPAFDALAPTTTKGDLIVYNGTDNIRLGVGSNAYVLTADSTAASGVKWAASPAGFVDPMTTRGDIIIRNSSNNTARLGVGTNTQVLSTDGTDTFWDDSVAFNPNSYGTANWGSGSGFTWTFNASNGTDTTLGFADGYAVFTGNYGVSGKLAVGSLSSFASNTSAYIFETFATTNADNHGLLVTINQTGAPTANYVTATTNALNYSGTGATAYRLTALSGITTITSAAGAVNGARGTEGNVTHESTSTITSVVGLRGSVGCTGGGTITMAANVGSSNLTVTAGTIVDLAGFWVENPQISGTGAITRFYGLYLPTFSGPGTSYGIYQVGTNTNVIGGLTQFQNSSGIEIGKDATTNTAGTIKLWGAGANNYYTTITTATQTANESYTIPTAMPSVSGYLLSSTTAGVTSWVAPENISNAQTFTADSDIEANGQVFVSGADYIQHVSGLTPTTVYSCTEPSTPLADDYDAFRAFKIDTDRTMVIANVTDQASSLDAMVATIDADEEDFTYGDKFDVGSAVSCFDACQLSSTKFLTVYALSGHTYARVLSVSGTTITGGTQLEISATNTSSIGVDTISSSQAILQFFVGGQDKIDMVVLDISGTTITENTNYTLISGTTKRCRGVAMLTATKGIAMYVISTGDSNLYAKVVDIDVDGTTLSFGAEETLTAAGGSNGAAGIIRLSNRKAAICYRTDGDSDGDGAIRALTVSGTDITTGDATTFTPFGGNISHNIKQSMVRLSSSRIGLVDSQGGGSGTIHFGTYDVTGTTWALNSEINISGAVFGGVDGMCVLRPFRIFIIKRNADPPDRPYIRIVGMTPDEGRVGVSPSAITEASTGSIYFRPGTKVTLSGLTAGTKYNVDFGGQPTTETSADQIDFGVAISTTSLLTF